jgi:cyclopropane-fatty-acyl-phospholipid synthase
MWISLLDRMLVKIFKTGDLHVTMPDGTTHTYGDGTEPTVRIQLIPQDLPKRLLNSPELVTGEAYMDGELLIEDDDVIGFLTIGLQNLRGDRAPVWWQTLTPGIHRVARRLQQYNPIGKAQSNVSHHYDLSGELYDLFLDKDKQYSCGYFRDPGNELELAQIDKKNHIAGKLLIEPGMKVLDIGCGWGGMGLTLAKDFGAQVVGVTLSTEQHGVAQARAKKAGLSDKVDFRLTDYRNIDEKFDRIVSVGMFEHVGVPHFREYFRHVGRMLAQDGVALIHTIGRNGPPSTTSPWVAKHIFPGGYVPSLSEAMAAIEDEGLTTTDIEVWRLHYAYTLKHWYDRFQANREKAAALYDERFCRMWTYYLVAAEMSFRLGIQNVLQFQLTHDQEAVPLTRDYLYPPATI